MSTTEVLTIQTAEVRVKDSTHKKKHARTEKSSKTPQSDQDGLEPEAERKRKRKKEKDAEAGNPGQEKDRKAKKRAKQEDKQLGAQTGEPTQAEQSVGVDTPELSKKEKKGKRHSGSVKSDAEEHIVQEEVIGESHERATEKELKRARKEARRQEKADRVASKDAAAVDSPDTVEKKKNKDEKKRKTESDEAVRKPKKRRTSSGVAQDIPNPEEDEELPEQARKALSYAYAQFADETNWKFNKARQNWLLRNLWAESNVPDKFMPLLSKYFAKVQGGVREASAIREIPPLRFLLHLLTSELPQNLIKTCRDRLAMPVVVTSPEVGTSPTEAPQNATEPASTTLSTTSEAMRSRARTMLEALGVS